LRFYDRQHKLPTNLGMLLFGKHPEMFIPSAYIQYVKFGGSDNGSDILAEHAYKGPLLQTIDEINSFVKVGIAAPRPVKVSALQEETISMYPDWAVRELLLNAIIHRDYQIGNAPVKFYDYNNIRLEISNPGGLYGQANPENFPYVNDYRNPLLAEAMKVMGYVNKYNRGIAKVKTEMEKNGNPTPQFDVNKLTEFRVTLLPSAKLQLITSNDELKVKNDELNGELNDKLFAEHGELNGASKETVNQLFSIISDKPGLQRKDLAKLLNVSVSTLDRYIKDLSGKIEHRGARKTGGWFPKS
ncbi:MAG: HTH domain-containing protein, partial [Lentisphaeria bacterium]|nr:HTH domain-containing protein [Lentisphaeria bacterium]